MRVVLVRVGADQSTAGGNYNGPIDPVTNKFLYVPIPEFKPMLQGLERPYAAGQFLERLSNFGSSLPAHLRGQMMHLDPDFEHCTYGDQGQRAVQLRKLGPGDLIVFYSGLRAEGQSKLIYALIGQITVESFKAADQVSNRDTNAHTRRTELSAKDLVVVGVSKRSGRYARCIPVGEWRDGAYRITRELLANWGGISASDGYIQRSARLPSLLQPQRFMAWLDSQRVTLVQNNF